MSRNKRSDDRWVAGSRTKSWQDDVLALRTFVYESVGVMTVLVPVWMIVVVALGHGALVASDPSSLLLHLFVGLASVIAVVPLMLVAQQAIAALCRGTPSNRREGMVPMRLAILLTSYYFAAIAFGLIAAGSPTRPLSADPAVILTGAIAIGLLLASLAVALIEALHARPKRATADQASAFRRLGYYSLIPMALLAPAWVVDGREFLGVGTGVGGQVGFVLAVTIAPIMFAGQQLLVLLASKDPRSRRGHAVSRRLAIALSIYYASAVVLGLAVIDRGSSVLTRLLGTTLAEPSSLIAGGATATMILSLAGCIVIATRDLRRVKSIG